jgi:RES domain-containing protein
MIVYRITLDKYSDKLYASGNPARWNPKDVKLIYAAGSRALACLENIVHRNSRGQSHNFKTLLIEIPKGVKIDKVNTADLPEEWQLYENMGYTQEIGEKWIVDEISAVLRVPSAIIPEEFNYLLNPAHKHFRLIRLVGAELFRLDSRL